ncbi:MAG: polysaccharide biosynthesis protein [Oscillospiraceae bacterium]|nr:polysaccharide biosynthesis protein [Oscillospiraceae bacterium]
MGGSKGQTLTQGAFILVFATIIVKIIGAIFKLPLGRVIGETGMGYFSAAYALYNPIYSITAVGFTSALSRLIAEHIAKNRYRDVQRTRRVARRLFITTGTLGFIAMTGGSFLYIKTVDPDSIYSILAMCPSVFFCCVMASYRGYYEGTRNMFPTAISQVIESLGKLFLGLGSAIAIVKIGDSQFNSTGIVYGELVSNLDQARMVSYKYAAAGAILGITIGSFIALCYLIFRSKKSADSVTDKELRQSPVPVSDKTTLINICKIGIPIALGALALTLTQLIDAATIQTRIRGLDLSALNQFYTELCGLNAEGTGPLFNYAKDLDKIPVALYGSYNYAVNIYSLVPTITQAVGISALPAVAFAWTRKDFTLVKKNINSVVRIITLIGIPAGFGICFLSGPILKLLYGGNPGAFIAEPMLRVLGIMVIFGTFVTPVNSMLQAIGKQTTTVMIILGGAAIKLIMNYTLVGIQDINIKGAPFGSLFCYIFIVVSGFIILLKNTKMKMEIVPMFIKPLIAGLACGVSAWVAYGLLSRLTGDDSSIFTVIAIAVGGIFYVTFVFLLKIFTKDDILMLPKGEKIANMLAKYKIIS